MWQPAAMYLHPGQMLPRQDDVMHAMFEIVPPTPSVSAPMASHPYAQPHVGLHTHAHTLRSHRSDSSIASQASAYSELGWSTVTSMSSMNFADSPSQNEVDRAFTKQYFPEPHLNRNMIEPKAASRPATLSIDPKLFQPKSRSSSVATTDEDGGEVLTAKPPKTPRAKGKRGGSGGTDGERKVSHARKQHPNHIPRPRNAFILFRKHVVDSKLIPASVEMRHQNVSIITAKMWAEASPEQKAHFNDLARIEKEEHMKKYPGYRYQPVYRRTNVIRRRVRKDEAEEEKCREVAELLMKGKSGVELESEIKDKIKNAPSAAPMPAPKKEKSSAGRRDSGAVALSKGSLRVLRAQARQSSVSEWSDISRCNSTAPSSLGDDGSLEVEDGLSRSTSFGFSEYSPSEGASEMYDEGELYSEPPPVFQHAPFGFDSTWTNQVGPTLSYPDRSSIPLQTYAYPQPAPPQDFYAYDQALPFSLSAAMLTFGHQPQPQLLQQAASLPSDLVFPAFDASLSPVPASRFTSEDAFVAWNQLPAVPPSSDIPFDALNFGSDGMLDDFGAALAQAQELGTW